MATNMIIKEDDLFIQYRYTITEFYILIGDKEDQIPVERISSMSIENYYGVATFPIFSVSLLLEPSRYFNIIQNKDTVRFKVRIQKYYLENGTQNKSLLRDVINDTFCLFLDDGNRDYQLDLKKEGGTEDDIDQLEKTRSVVELFLFKDIVTSLRSSINTVLTDCDPCTAVTYLLSKAKVKNVLMSPFDNKTKYSNIIIPPLQIDKAIQYLNYMYGFHKNGSMVYFGLFNNYILNHSSACTAWKQDEWKETVLVILESVSDKALEGSYIRKNELRNYYNLSPYSITVINKTVSENVLSGTSATVIDPKNNTTVKNSSNAIVSGNENESILYDNTSNPYFANVFNYYKKLDSTVLSANVKDMDMEIFKPNKAFSVIFENQSLNALNGGKYLIYDAIYTFERSGDVFLLNGVLSFKKTP